MENLDQLGLVEMQKEELQETEGGLFFWGIVLGFIIGDIIFS